MDPVKEKLLLLKKLANEKKANQNSSNNENNSNNNNNNLHESSSKLEVESSSASSSAAVALAEDNTNTSNIISSSTNEKNKRAREQQQQQQQKQQQENQQKHQEENKEAVKKSNLNNNSSSTNKNSSNNSKSTNNSNKLNVVEDHLTTATGEEASEGEETAADESSFVVALEDNTKKQKTAETNTMNSQNRSAVNEPKDNNASSAFKYINRMKHLYDRERASSTESINSTRQPLPASAAFMQRKKPQAVLSPQSSLLGRGGDEIISDQDDQSSIMTSSNAGGNAPRSNKYIKHLMDSFNSGQAPTRLTADSPNETKRNSIGETAMSSTQIDRIKEKFAKMNNIQENSGSQSSKRHSTMFGGHNQDRAPVLANYMNSALSKSLKSLNTIDLGDMGGRIAHGNSVMSMSMSMQPHEANIVAAPSSKRAMNKYQKSITCDLSSYILGGNKQEEEQTTPTNSTRIVANDSDYDSLFDRFSALDAKYMPENAIIRSSLSTSNANPTINKHREQHQNQDYHSIPTIITTDATPTSKPQTPFSFPNVQQPQQQQQQQHQTIKRPVHLQQPQQVKSILKSPSSTSEKSIHFDDHIDVIQIDDRLSTATSSPPSTSQPPEQDTDNPSSTTTSTAIEQPPHTNLELFKPLKGISQTEMAKNMLFHQTKASSQQPQLPPHHFSNEIEAIKKMLLEPISITRQNDLVPEYAALNRAKSSGNGNGGPAAQRTSRVFIKSPTPMRELPNYQDAQDANKNRNRFTKKKLSSSLRSQSADFNDSLVAEEIDDQIIDDGRRDNFPVPHHLRVSPMPSASNNNRPNLTRQNALGKHASRHQQQQQLQYQQQTTKSLSENLNFAHYYHQSPPKLDPTADPSKPPKSALTNRLLAKLTTNKHGRHGHPKSKKSSSRNRHSNRGGSSKHQHHKNKKRQFERSSSLTDSSQSEESDLTESDLSTASSSSSASSEEQNARAHSDSFLSSSANTSLDDLAQLNNELLRADDRNTHLQPPHHHSNQPSDRLLPPKQKKRTPVFNVFDKAGAGKQQQKSSHHKRSGNQVASNQQQLSRHTFYSSDDSVCGIPKPSSKLASSSRLCSSGKPFHKSMDELSGGYNRVETSTSTIPKAQTIATKSSTTGSTSQQQHQQQQQSTMSNLLTSGRSRVHNHPGTQIATLTNNKTSTTSRAENKENNNNKQDDDDEKYPSFDDQDSHLSRNPTSLLSHNSSSSHNNTNKLAAHQHLFYPSTHHQTHQNNELYFNKPSTTPLSTINNELYNNTTTVKSPPPATNRLQQPQQEMTFERKPSTESSKSSQQQKKPLPSYSQLVQSNPNAFQFYQQQQPQQQPQKQPARYDNNLVPVGGGNNNSSFANGLYSLNDPNRIVQPYQHNLLNQSSSVARDSFLSPPRQTSYHQNQQQQSYAGPNYPSSHHHPNESMLAFQQSRSRSLDANMYYDAHPEVLSKYVEDEQQSNLINDHHDYSNNIRSSMPSQSLAIQEKLKMFEQTSPPPTNTTVQQQNSNIFDVNSGITGRKLYQPSTTAATSIQQQQQYNDQIVGYPQQQATKRNSFEPTSTTATSTTNNNKENSPYNYKMMTMPASTQQQQQQQQRYNYYQQPPQQQRPYNPASIEPTFHATTTNKFPSLIDTSNVIERSSPPKSASNTYKYGGSKTTSANSRSSGFINPNLAAATAAAAAALNAVTGTQTLDFGTNSGSSSSGASRSKMMRQDSGNNFTPSMQYSAYEGRSPSQNLNEMSSNSNSAKIVDQQKEKSMEKVLLMQTPPNVFKNQPQYNRDSLIDTTTASLSLNSTNNNANNNELPKKRVFYDNRPQTNSITFTKSNISPTKVATSASLPSQQQQQQQLNTTIDDIEMLSSSPSSTSSLKEAIRQKQMTINNNPGLIGHNHHSNKHLTVGGGSVDMTVSSISGHTTTSSVLSSASGASGGKDHRRNSDEMIGEQYMENNEEMSNENNGGENRDEEPSKLSLSEKMKLFSNSSALAAGLRPKYAAANQNVVAASGAKFNRFQTQPISSADLDYANKLATNNNNNNKFLTSIENNIHMINTNNNNNNTNTKTSSSLTTPTTPKLDNHNHNNNQQSSNNNNSFKRFIDTNGNTKDSSIAPSNNNNNNNAISSSTAPAKTITLFKSQTTKLQQKIINDNHLSDKTSSKMSSNETAAVATTTATTNAEPNEEVVIDEESSSKQAEQPQQQREPKRYKFKSKTDVVTKTNETGGIEQRTETTTASLEETNENSRPPTAGEPTSVAQLEIGMTIQERMAALKKIGEESNNSWKRRPVAATSNTVEAPSQINTESSQPNIVKQQKEQIQLQLKQMLTTTKSKMQAAESSKQQSPRNVLSTLDDNNNQHENADLNVKPSTAAKQSDHDLFMSKKALIEKRVLFTPPEQHHVRLTKPTSPEAIAENTKPKITSSRVHKHSGSDTDTMYTRNASLVGQQQQTTTKNERVELFSTDSEMDSFFKENENILQQQNFLSSSSTTTGGSNNKAEQKTDDNTMNDDESFDDVEFDRLVTEANRLTQRTRAKPSRKTKSKGNHLKNLQNRMEIKNEYEQQSRVPVVSTAAPTVLKSSVSPSKSNFNN